MKQRFAAALLLTALLAMALPGCGQTTPAQNPLPRLTPTKETENDNLRCYPLDAANCRFLTLGEDLLVLRPTDGGAELLRCAGKGLTVTARTEVPPGAELTAGGQTVCCYDPDSGQALLFSRSLTPLGRFSLPDCASAPLPDSGGSRIYYCTAQALMELDTETGIHRQLRQESGLTLTALLEESGLLVCGRQDSRESLYIRVSDGGLQQRSPQVTGAAVLGSRVHLCVQCGFLDCLYLGQTMLPLAADWKFLAFLPAMNAALVLQEGSDLAIYDLSTGNRLAQRTLKAPWQPERAWATEDGRVFFTGGGALYQWEPVWEATRDSRVRITALYTREQPNEKGLEQCRQRGAYLENQYGAQVLLNTDATRVAPKGVLLEPEHITATILDTLAGMEVSLGRFPPEFVKTVFSGMGRVYLCPVRSIRVDGQERLGLQFWSGRDCYLVVAASAEIDRAVIQVLSPLVERRILMNSSAFDTWDNLNPPGFAYGSGDFDDTAFVSPDCLASPAADRAGLLCAALEPGNRERFLSAQLQNKLRALCAGIREAIPLEENARRPWEQYLWKRQ